MAMDDARIQKCVTIASIPRFLIEWNGLHLSAEIDSGQSLKNFSLIFIAEYSIPAL